MSEAERPVPAQRAHDLGQHKAILAELLEVERARLQEALRIERERSMVFPETTVIARDIQRLAAAVYGAIALEGQGAEREGQEPGQAAPPPVSEPDDDGGALDLESLARELGV